MNTTGTTYLLDSPLYQTTGLIQTTMVILAQLTSFPATNIIRLSFDLTVSTCIVTKLKATSPVSLSIDVGILSTVALPTFTQDPDCGSTVTYSLTPSITGIEMNEGTKLVYIISKIDVSFTIAGTVTNSDGTEVGASVIYNVVVKEIASAVADKTETETLVAEIKQEVVVNGKIITL